MAEISILFVCLGNICRSPMAEGIFQHLVEQEGLHAQFVCDSAGTSAYHAGELADARMRQTAQGKNIRLTSRARQVQKADFSAFDYVIAMDESNFQYLERLKSGINEAKAELFRMRDFDPEGEGDVPDPYYGGDQGFEDVFEILRRSNEAFIEFLKDKHL